MINQSQYHCHQIVELQTRLDPARTAAHQASNWVQAGDWTSDDRLTAAARFAANAAFAATALYPHPEHAAKGSIAAPQLNQQPTDYRQPRSSVVLHLKGSAPASPPLKPAILLAEALGSAAASIQAEQACL